MNHKSGDGRAEGSSLTAFTRILVRRSEVFLLAVTLVLLAILAHYIIAEPLTLQRSYYPLQASVTKLDVRCSDDAPQWLSHLLIRAIDHQGAMASQLAYISPDGTLSHCESGWVGGMLLSPRVVDDTRFRFASLTKLLTADAILLQINNNRIHLDTKLLDLLPEVRPVADERLEKITIQQLLKHTAGFDRFRQTDPMTKHKVKAWCPSEISELKKTRLDFEPGERQAYSNLGYCLLGVVLERLSGLSYRDYMEREYRLSERGIRFIDGPYLPDEVKYDFRNSEQYGEEYYRYIDMPSLSSAAGLSGSAVALGQLLKEVLTRQPLNLMSIEPDVGCKPTKHEECYGASARVVHLNNDSLSLHIQGGLIYGTVSKVVMDSRGGVTVFLGGGMPSEPKAASDSFVREISESLSDYYAALENAGKGVLQESQ